ncbi:hypothetical protein [Stappia indica]|uniref:hypothetical protein n=1 Tax=Stappia indica TaxID=538381 RepID=UPI001D18BE0F|nr:hypothetical protein [Stappia indica]MCC4243428.1 hypothetical protein [Stappia indica]
MSQAFPIPVDTRERNYTATAGQTVFAADFPFQQTADVKVYHRLAAGGPYELLEEAADYTLTGAGNPLGGAVTLTTGAAVGDKIRIRGEAVLARTSSVVQAGVFKSSTLDDELDRNRIIQQEQERDSDDAQAKLLRAMLTPEGETIGELPALADRKAKLMAFDADGNPTVAQAIDTTPEYPALEKRFNTVDELRFIKRGTLGDGETISVSQKDNPKRGGRFMWIADLILPHDGGVVIRHSDGLPGGVVRLYTGFLWVEFWDAIASDGTDVEAAIANASRNHAAIQAALNYCKTFPNGNIAGMSAGGHYYVDDELDTYTGNPSKRVGLFGMGPFPTSIFAYFRGAGKALFKGSGPNGERTGGPWLENLMIRLNVDLPGRAPRAIECRMADYGYLNRLQIIGDYTNGLWEYTGAWNSTFSNLEMWGGGTFIGRKKVPAGVTFSGLKDGNTITASDDCFDVEDEGKIITLVETTALAGRYLIQTRNSPTEVTVSEPLPETYDGAYGWLDGVRGSIDIGTSTTTLILEDAVLTEDLEGMTVFVPTARTGAGGTTRPLIAKISEVLNDTTCTLSAPANRSVTNETVYFGPAWAIYDDLNGNGDVNDVLLHNVCLQGHAGCGGLFQGVHLVTSGPLKNHGRAMFPKGPSPRPYNDEVAQVSLYLNLIGGQIVQAGFESQAAGESKILCEGLISGLQVLGYRGALIENQKIFHAFNCNAWAVPDFGNGYMTSTVEQSDKTFPVFTHDGSLRKIRFSGGPPAYYTRRSTAAYGQGGVTGIAFSSSDERKVQEKDTVIRIPLPPGFTHNGNKQKGGKLSLSSCQNIDAACTVHFNQNVNTGTGALKIESQVASLFIIGTGVLDPGTATDNKVTLSLNGADPYIQVCNRVGTIIWDYLIEGG